MTEYKTIREILRDLYIDTLQHSLENAFKEDVGVESEKINKALTSIRKLMLEAVGSDKAHSISHGDIIHPYETDHDAGYNQRGAEIKKRIEELTKGN